MVSSSSASRASRSAGNLPRSGGSKSNCRIEARSSLCAGVAIRSGQGDWPNLRSHLLLEQDFTPVASPAYLATAPALERAADLSSHACIDAHSAADMGAWRVVEAGRARTVRVSGRFVLSNVVAVERAAIAGAGVARIPEYLARHALAKGTLVEVLPRVTLPTRTLHAVHPAGKKTPERVRTFLAFLVDELPRALVP